MHIDASGCRLENKQRVPLLDYKDSLEVKNADVFWQLDRLDSLLASAVVPKKGVGPLVPAVVGEVVDRWRKLYALLHFVQTFVVHVLAESLHFDDLSCFEVREDSVHDSLIYVKVSADVWAFEHLSPVFTHAEAITCLVCRCFHCLIFTQLSLRLDLT